MNSRTSSSIPNSLATVSAMWNEALRANIDANTGEPDWEIVAEPTIWFDACRLQPGYV